MLSRGNVPANHGRVVAGTYGDEAKSCVRRSHDEQSYSWQRGEEGREFQTMQRAVTSNHKDETTSRNDQLHGEPRHSW